MNNRIFTGKYFAVEADIDSNTFDRFIVLDTNGQFLSDWYFDCNMQPDDYMRLIMKLDAMPSDELCRAFADEFELFYILNPTTASTVETIREYGIDYINVIDNHLLFYI